MSRHSFFLPAFLFLILISPAFSSLTFAENPETEDQDIPQLDEYVVEDSPVDDVGYTGSRLGIPLKEIPATFEIINQDTIRQRGNRLNLDVVEGAVGWSAANSPGNGTVFSNRGFILNDIQILSDGTRNAAPVNTSRRQNSFQFKRIEVLNGPASVLHGESTTSGTVNYISKTPNPVQYEHEAQLSYGSFDTVNIGLGSGGPTGLDGLSYRIDGSLFDTNGFVDRSGYEIYQVNGSVRYDLAPNLFFTLAAEYFEDDIDAYYGTPLNGGKIDTNIREKNYNVSDNIQKMDSTWIRFFANWKPVGWVEVKNQFYYYMADRRWRNAEGYTFTPSTGMVSIDSLADITHDQDLIGNRFQVLLPQPLFGQPNRFLAGFEVRWNDFTRDATFFNGVVTTSAFNPTVGTFASAIDPSPSLVSNTRTKTDTTSFFFEDQFTVLDNLKLIGGARVDWIDVDSENLANGSRVTPDFNPVSWRAGVVYDVLPQSTLYSQYTVAVIPSFEFEFGRFLTLFNELETSKQIEVGLKQGLWGNRAEVNIALYYLVKENIINEGPGGNAQQIGEQSSKGLEMSFKVRPIPAWFIQGNFTVLEAEFEDFTDFNTSAVFTGNQPANIPETLANFWTGYQVNQYLEFGGNLRYVSRRWGDNPNTFSLPAYYTLGLHSTVTYKQLQFTLRGRNITGQVIALRSETDFGPQVQIANPASVEFMITIRN